MVETLEPAPLPRRMPKVLLFIQPCTLIEDFLLSDGLDQLAYYDEECQMSILPEGLPLYCARFPRIKTQTLTPGHTLPARYNAKNQLLPPKFVPSKTDMRAGK